MSTIRGLWTSISRVAQSGYRRRRSTLAAWRAGPLIAARRSTPAAARVDDLRIRWDARAENGQPLSPQPIIKKQASPDSRWLIDRMREKKIIVVDDESRDALLPSRRIFEVLRLFRHPFNRGYGAALKTGMTWRAGTLSPGSTPTTSTASMTLS